MSEIDRIKEIIDKIEFEVTEIGGKQVEAVAGVDSSELKILVEFVEGVISDG